LLTFAALTNSRLPDDRVLDGRSFVPQLNGQKGNPREWVYQLWEENGWIRTADWKLYQNNILFDMKNDPFEQKPIKIENDSKESSAIRKFLKEELTKLELTK